MTREEFKQFAKFGKNFFVILDSKDLVTQTSTFWGTNLTPDIKLYEVFIVPNRGFTLTTVGDNGKLVTLGYKNVRAIINRNLEEVRIKMRIFIAN